MENAVQYKYFTANQFLSDRLHAQGGQRWSFFHSSTNLAAISPEKMKENEPEYD